MPISARRTASTRPTPSISTHCCTARSATSPPCARALAPLIDRPLRQLSPVEHAALLIGAYELRNHLEIPYRVVINEAVELTKSFGGVDGHKYVNGVLDKFAARARQAEVEAAKR